MAVKTQQMFLKDVKEEFQYRMETKYVNKSKEREEGVSWHQVV